MPEAGTFTGGCQCGAVRFRATGVLQAVICHCRMCQKAVGNYFAPLIVVEKLDWTRGMPRFFRSSNKAQRGFCESCGTPLIYLGDDGSREILGGAFDDPQFVVPEKQINVAAKLPVYDRLPHIPHNENVEAEMAFNATIVNHQHPDHDTEHWSAGEGKDD